VGLEFAFQVDAGAEVDPRHAERSRGLDVPERIVDEDELLRLSPDLLEQARIDARVGLRRSDMAGDHCCVELVEEVKHLAGDGELDRGEVAQRVDRAAGASQPPEQRDVLLDRSAQGLDPPLVEQMELAREFGKGPRALGDSFRKIRDDVGERNEIHRERG
jgi:hypothetical protein